jgi:hypothetical protein
MTGVVPALGALVLSEWRVRRGPILLLMFFLCRDAKEYHRPAGVGLTDHNEAESRAQRNLAGGSGAA